MWADARLSTWLSAKQISQTHDYGRCVMLDPPGSVTLRCQIGGSGGIVRSRPICKRRPNEM